jgi:SAM-dependent methyltransferase
MVDRLEGAATIAGKNSTAVDRRMSEPEELYLLPRSVIADMGTYLEHSMSIAIESVEEAVPQCFQLCHPSATSVDPRAHFLSEACGYPPSDLEVFLAGYSELCREDLNGKDALEICSGLGALSAQMARTFPDSRITALDLYVPTGSNAGWGGKPPNLEFRAGSAFDLSFLRPESVDLVWGQAALHHLAFSPSALCAEVMRVLKPGGRLVFVFEPMGHNLLVAMIRAARVSMAEEPDESNLFLSQIKKMSAHFSTTQVQSFNLFSYPLKAFSNRISWISSSVRRFDAALFSAFPRLLRYGANCNIIFTK